MTPGIAEMIGRPRNVGGALRAELRCFSGLRGETFGVGDFFGGSVMSLGYLACSFDLLNVGHLDLIAQARELCDRLIVGVYTDEAIERADGRPPVTPLAERAALVGHVRGVDEVVVHETVPVRGAAATLVLVDDGSRTVAVREIELVPRRGTASAVLSAALQPSHAEAEPISA